jgi:hypothetical protein
VRELASPSPAFLEERPNDFDTSGRSGLEASRLEEMDRNMIIDLQAKRAAAQ